MARLTFRIKCAHRTGGKRALSANRNPRFALAPSRKPETQFFKGFSRGESGGEDLETGGPRPTMMSTMSTLLPSKSLLNHASAFIEQAVKKVLTRSDWSGSARLRAQELNEVTCDVFGRLPLRKMSDAIEHDLLVWADDEAPRPRDRSGGPRARRLVTHAC